MPQLSKSMACEPCIWIQVIVGVLFYCVHRKCFFQEKHTLYVLLTEEIIILEVQWRFGLADNYKAIYVPDCLVACLSDAK